MQKPVTPVEWAKRFLTFVGSSLAAITALFYAAGFIAETSRWAYLGHTPPAISQQQYLLTGAAFFLLELPSLFDGVLVLASRHLTPTVIILLAFGLLAALGYRSRRHVTLLAAEGLLLGVLTYLLLFAPTSFIGPTVSNAEHLSLFERDLLLRASAPPRAVLLQDNYSLLVLEFVLSLIAALVIYLTHREKVRAQGTAPVAEGARAPSRRRSLVSWPRVLFIAFRDLRPSAEAWRLLHRSTLLVVNMFLVVMLLLLPMNFSQLLLHDDFSVVELTWTTTNIDPGSTIFLLREDTDRYLFFVRTSGAGRKGSFWLANKSDVRDLRIIANRSLWD